jgi:hypothetical protein
MKYAEYDNSGNIIAFYDDAIHTNIPEQSVEITDNQWQDCLANPGKNIVSGGVFASASNATLLQLAKTAKINELTRAYNSALISDFNSSALGSSHTYACDMVSQAMLNSLITAGNTANYIYYNSGSPVVASHSLAELQQVLDDLITAQQTAISNYNAKVAAVNAATTVTDVNAITW